MTLSIDLSGKRAFVSGVTRGIGAGIARQLAVAGCDVSGCGMSAPGTQAVDDFYAMLRSYGREGFYLRGNLSQSDAPSELMGTLGQEWSKLDILVSNAGRNVFKGAEHCTQAEWDECMNLDLTSHWRLSKAALPLLRGDDAAMQPGVIVVIGSNHAHQSIPGCFPYNVAKAGLLGLVQSLAIEWSPRVRCVGIAPGFIDTPGNDTWFDSFPDPEAERERTERRHPVGRIGSIDEIGGLCVFLASDYGGFISGTTLLVDGGRSALMQDVEFLRFS